MSERERERKRERSLLGKWPRPRASSVSSDPDAVAFIMIRQCETLRRVDTVDETSKVPGVMPALPGIRVNVLSAWTSSSVVSQCQCSRMVSVLVMGYSSLG